MIFDFRSSTLLWLLIFVFDRFHLKKSSLGVFSGWETVFWTTEPNCRLTQTTAVYAPVRPDGSTGYMSLVAKPANYTLCYDDGRGEYVFQPHVQLTIKGPTAS